MNAASKKILIADDDPVARRLLERTLQRLGHVVVAVTDGAAAQRCQVSPRMWLGKAKCERIFHLD